MGLSARPGMVSGAGRSVNTVEATGVLFAPHPDDPAALTDVAGRQPVIDLTRRLKPAAGPVDENKLTPFLGMWGQLLPGQAPHLFVVKVIALPGRGAAGIGVAAARLLANEEDAARRNDLLVDGVPAVGSGGGYAWVIRRYIEGLTLAQLAETTGIDRNRGPLARLLLERIVDLHQRTYLGHPLCHGDIKPANVIVQVRDRDITGVKLIDHESGGVSDAAGPAYRHATFQFASPEHFLEPRIGQSADVFSWALTVLDMYAPGRHPYVTLPAGPAAYEQAYANPAREPDETVIARVDDDALRGAVREALTLAPQRRPSARALLDRISPLTNPPRPAPVEAPTVTLVVPAASGAPETPAPPEGADDPEATALHPRVPGAPAPHPPVRVPIPPPAPFAEAGPAAPGAAPTTPFTDAPTAYLGRPAPGAGMPGPVPTRPVSAPSAPPQPVTAPSAPTQPVPGGSAGAWPPLPVVRPEVSAPAVRADPDSIPAQLRGWWGQIVAVDGWLGSRTFGVGAWAGYGSAAAVLGGLAGFVLAVLLLALTRGVA